LNKELLTKNIYLKQIMFILVLLVSVPLNAGFIVILGLIFLSLNYLVNNQALKAFQLFFTIVFLLPYDFNNLIFNNNIGNFIDNSFLACIPLYICFPLIFKRNNTYKNKNYSNVITFFFIIFFYSTLLKGFGALFLGGETVRFSLAINYLNAFLVAYWGYKIFRTNIDFQKFIYHIIILGMIASLLGIIQYLFKFYFFHYTYVYIFYERLSIIPFIDPVDLFPFLIVPFSFAVNYHLNNTNNRSLIVLFAAFIIFIAALFTWSRWGIACLVLIVVISFFMAGKVRKLLIVVTILFLIGSVSVNTFYDFLPKNQTSRVESGNNLFLRYVLWNSAISAINKNLWLGVGLGNAANATFDEGLVLADLAGTSSTINNTKDIQFQSIHQYFLDLILSMGIFIIIPLFLLYYLFFKNYMLVVKNAYNPIKLVLIKGMASSIVGLSVFWMQNTGYAHFWLFLFFALSFVLANQSSIGEVEIIKIEKFE